MKFGGFLILPLLLVPAQALTVCADPNYLPYSNRAGEGFENKVAAAVAKALGEPLEYTWASHRGHGGFTQFLSTTLDAKKCDVVMSIPYGSREELTTRPYYISSYVFVYPKSKKYNITTMDAPVLKSLKIGFERDTPAEDSLKIRGMIPGITVPFDISDEGTESPATMLAALKDGRSTCSSHGSRRSERFCAPIPTSRSSLCRIREPWERPSSIHSPCRWESARAMTR